MRLALVLLITATFQAHAYNTNIMHDDGSDAGKVPVTATHLNSAPDEAQTADEPQVKAAAWKGFDGPDTPAVAGGYAQPSSSSSSGSAFAPEGTAPSAQASATARPSTAAAGRTPTAATIPQGQPLNPTQFPTVQTPTPPTAPATPAPPAGPNPETGGFLGIRGSAQYSGGGVTPCPPGMRCSPYTASPVSP